ncbi:hypothetical protein BDV18DRAFT_113838 [Aspergillus unguis]
MSNFPSLPSVKTKAFPAPAPNGQGRGLFVSVDLKPCDDILHIRSPFVAVLDTERLEDTCSGCFGKRQLESEVESGSRLGLKACTGCQVVRYCDKTCQAKDWKLAHSRECAIYKNLKPRILPINARALLRMVLRTGAKKEPYTPDELDLFQSLETHVREIREANKGQFERIALTSKAVKEYSGASMEEEVLSAYGAKLDLNSFNLTNALYDRVGMYLHPYAALINHSCDYNAVMGFDGAELYIKAVRPIAKDEQIFISYIDTTFPKRIRQKELRERFFFTCQCIKCTEEDANPEQEPEPTSPAGIVSKTAYSLLKSSFTSADEGAVGTLMQGFISFRLPKTKQPFVSVFDELIVREIPDQLNHAFLHCALRFLRIDPVVYVHEAHPLRAVHAWALARITLQISQEYPDLKFPTFKSSDNSEQDGGSLSKSPGAAFDYGLLAWALLAELVGNEMKYCTVPGFRDMVRRAFGEVHEEFLRHGVDPREMRDEVRREWTTLRMVAGNYWKCSLLEAD